MRDSRNSVDLRPEARTWGEVFSRGHLSGRGLVGVWVIVLPITLLLIVTLVTEPVTAGTAGTVAWVGLMGAILFKASRKYMASRAQEASERRFADPSE